MFFLILAHLISWVSNVFIIILLARSVLSWVVYSGYRRYPQLGRLYNVLCGITEPVVAPVRRLLSRFVNTGSIDFAPLATFFIIIIASRILIGLFNGLYGMSLA